MSSISESPIAVAGEIPAAASPNKTTSRGLALLLGLLLVAALYFVYHGTFQFKLLTWDDDQHVTDNRYFQPLTWKSWLHFWGYSFIYLYIPVSYNFFACEVWLSQLFPSADPSDKFNPAVFHIGNVLVHLGCTLLAYRLLLKLTRHAPAACCGALLFALHPLQAESVAWVGETRGTLATLFSFAALWFYLQYAGVDPEQGIFAATAYEPATRRRRDYLLALVCYAAALLSKPSAASWPLVVLLTDVVLLRRRPTTTLWRLAPWFLGAVVITGLTKYYQKTDIIYQPSVPPLWQRPFVAGDAYAFYLTKLVWPFDMAFDYGRTPHYVAESPYFYRAWLVPAIVAALLACCRRRRIWLTCFGIFIVAVLPVSGLVPFLYQSISTTADRYMNIPLFGFGLLLAAWLASRRSPAVPLLAAALALGFCAHRTIEQCATWRDDWTLYRNALRVTPRSFMSHLNLAYRYRTERQFEQALPHYARVLEIRPDYLWAHYGSGLCYIGLDRPDDAIKEYRAALGANPNLMEIQIGLGDALGLKNDLKGAEEAYRAAVKAAPKDALPQLSLGEFLFRRRRFDEGETAFRKALELEPDLPEFPRRYGVALLNAEQFSEAAPLLERVVADDPKSVRARVDLASCYYSQSKFALAVEQAGAAVALDPKSFEARHNLGLALAAAGKVHEAREQFDAALRLVPPASPQADEVRKALGQVR